MCRRRIGVLAVQGAFAEHASRLRRLGCEAVELRRRADVLQTLDGLVLPGGESTAQAKLLEDLGMREPLGRLIREGLPVLGTCAGLILLAETVESTGDGRRGNACERGHGRGSSSGGVGRDCGVRRTRGGAAVPVAGFRTLPVSVLRNGYGRQLGSFAAAAPCRCSRGDSREIPLVFIRAPRIVSVGPGVETLVSFDGQPVAVRFGNQVGCCFHPELASDDVLYHAALLS